MKVSALGVEEQRVNVVMDFDDPLEAWAALGDGYRVEVRIVVWEKPTRAARADEQPVPRAATTGPSSRSIGGAHGCAR